ncbi:CASP-like protein 2C1 [Impatiens glandulifera]|uniref:CASP-like protein 2C1 n=1 Tax=Impatiens glandulifera TaxID=253017 RepID=UPI001FB0F6BF|nr:CASP-like protein 2C1 [Impatiens glandulifera]
MGILGSEGVLRLGAAVLLVVTACLVALDSQTKFLYYQIAKKATYKELNALYVVVWVHSAAAIYSLLQSGRCFFFAAPIHHGTSRPATSSYLTTATLCFILDQVVVYGVFSTNSAGVEASIMAITGADSFQWMKLCNKFTRFCYQIGGALLCGYVACLLMIVVSSISAFNLFRLYSPNKFLILKAK